MLVEVPVQIRAAALGHRNVPFFNIDTAIGFPMADLLCMEVRGCFSPVNTAGRCTRSITHAQ